MHPHVCARPSSPKSSAHTPSCGCSAGNRGPWLAGDSPPLRSRPCARSLPFRSPQTTPRSTGRFVEPPASPRVLGCVAVVCGGACPRCLGNKANTWAPLPRRGPSPASAPPQSPLSFGPRPDAAPRSESRRSAALHRSETSSALEFMKKIVFKIEWGIPRRAAIEKCRMTGA